MSTASFVPELDDLDAKDAIEELKNAKIGSLLKDSFIRFRRADAFSFARSMAFQVVLAVIPTVIMAVALAVRNGDGRLQAFIREGIVSLAPGPASEIFLRAFEQGSETLGRGNIAAIVGGGLAAAIAAVAAMGQLQRGASRIYGVQEDRPTFQRYRLASALALSVGGLLLTAFLAIVTGSAVGGAFKDEVAATWSWARWPLGVILVTIAVAAILKAAPNRKQPSFGWLTLGAAVGVIGWLLVSIVLAVYLNASTTFGETYGPLAGFIGSMLWALFSAIAIFFGIAVAAQLEAIAGGVTSPTIEPERQ